MIKIGGKMFIIEKNCYRVEVEFKSFLRNLNLESPNSKHYFNFQDHIDED
jgi:hypothetical protein